MQWDKNLKDLLRRLWDKGMPTKIIAETIGGGLTKNGVIGKAHRLGLASRKAPRKEGAKRTSEAPNAVQKHSTNDTGRPHPPIVPIPTPPPVTSEGVSLVDLKPFHCREVIGVNSVLTPRKGNYIHYSLDKG